VEPGERYVRAAGISHWFLPELTKRLQENLTNYLVLAKGYKEW
jgi:hypothetical protein